MISSLLQIITTFYELVFIKRQTLNFIIYLQYIYPLLGVNPFNLERRLGIYKYLRFNIKVGHKLSQAQNTFISCHTYNTTIQATVAARPFHFTDCCFKMNLSFKVFGDVEIKYLAGVHVCAGSVCQRWDVEGVRHQVLLRIHQVLQLLLVQQALEELAVVGAGQLHAVVTLNSMCVFSYLY